MRELDASLQQSGEFILKARLVKENAAPYCVRWVRRFLTRRAIVRAARRAGLDGNGPHRLRHTVCSHLAQPSKVRFGCWSPLEPPPVVATLWQRAPLRSRTPTL